MKQIITTAGLVILGVIIFILILSASTPNSLFNQSKPVMQKTIDIYNNTP